MMLLAALSVAAFRQASSQQQQSMNRAAPTMARADSAFQASAWQVAADDYRAIVRQDSANGMGWFRLGVSLEGIGRPDDAVQAYGRAATLGFQPVAAELRTARILTKKGMTTQAIERLRSAASRGLDPAMLDGDSTLAPLRALPAFAEVRAKAEETRYPCRATHTFDFWAGTFDAKPWDKPDAPSGGQLHNTREYDGCVIVERWTGANNAGMSMAFYDVNRRVWRMIWNDDSNSSNDFEGTYHDGAMRFLGWVLDAKGNRMLASNVLQDVSPDVIRHIYSTSSDSGKTWIVRSDGRFVRRKE
jgi:tetratricopeptide (TPR) repeat protein